MTKSWIRPTLLTLVLSLLSGSIFAANSNPPAPAEMIYFRQLLARSSKAPIEAFLHLWFPKDPVAGVDGYLLDCVDQKIHRLKDKGFLSPACQPDVLYSWGPRPKLESLRRHLQGSAWSEVRLNDFRSVWATTSPASSYSYGPIPIRIKIRPGTLFEMDFVYHPRTVVVSDASVTDFLLHTGDVIESWSFGTPEHYDEIVKDIWRIRSGKPVVTYAGPLGSTAEGMQRLYNAGVPENGPQDEATLRRNLTLMIRMILNGEGEIRYAPGISPDRRQHFATDRPMYFNEK